MIQNCLNVNLERYYLIISVSNATSNTICILSRNTANYANWLTMIKYKTFKLGWSNSNTVIGDHTTAMITLNTVSKIIVLEDGMLVRRVVNKDTQDHCALNVIKTILEAMVIIANTDNSVISVNMKSTTFTTYSIY